MLHSNKNSKRKMQEADKLDLISLISLVTEVEALVKESTRQLLKDRNRPQI